MEYYRIETIHSLESTAAFFRGYPLKKSAFDSIDYSKDMQLESISSCAIIRSCAIYKL